MAIFKCKMCGGALEISEGSSVAVCTFCGTKQTLPKLDNETRINLYDRANHFRRNNDYDKAMSIYEQLLNIDKTDAEAYWSILLCKYGVAYVEDPKTHKMLPTINRAQYTSIFADEDYKSAIHYADGYQKEVYEAEAKELDLIQKGILAISQKEEPFDVFICYKETDNYGRRTQDSVLAQDLYYQLTQEGFKVFFSRITLEDKLGTAYEPYIFAALNTAKVMVVIGTSKENFNAVWVKNEWSRFLELTKTNNKKVLIPAYRDMDPYDLPEEFSHLQAQDMSKLGFMQDLIRGIKKITAKDEPKTYVNVTAPTNNANIDALLKRAYIACEDGDFAKADDFAEQILNIDPEFAEAYMVKTLVDCRVRKLAGLRTYNQVIKGNSNFKRAYKYATGDLKSLIVSINNDNYEHAQYFPKYSKAIGLIKLGDYKNALLNLESIREYKDSDKLIEQCKTKIAESNRDRLYVSAINMGFSKAADDRAMQNAIDQLKSLNGYKDSLDQVDKLYARIDQYRYDQQIKAEKERERAIQRKRRRKIEAIIFSACVVIVAIILVLRFTVFIPMADYKDANALVLSGNYDEAVEIYEELGDYKDSELHIEKIKTMQAVIRCFEAKGWNAGIRRICADGGWVQIEYDCNGGTIGDSSDQKINETISDADQLKTAHRDGYEFYRWQFMDYEISYDLSQINLKVWLKADYTICDYSIKYDLDGGTVYGGTNPTWYRCSMSDLSVVNPTKRGYTFVGWSGSDIEGVTDKLVILSGSIGDRVYTANWVANEYTVSFDSDGGQLSVDDITVTFGENYSLSTPTKHGHAFSGWYSGNTLIYNNGVWDRTDDVDLVAKWDITTYSITYNLAGGTNSEDNPSTYTVSDDDFNLAEPTRNGYTFLGWSGGLLSGVTKDVYIPKGSIGNLTYTANWQANTYTITYDPNGGTMGVCSQTVTYDEKYALYPVNREGYFFDGWYDESDKKILSGTWNKTCDITLKAKWTPNTTTKYVVSHWLEGADDGLYSLYTSETLYGTTDASVTPAVHSYKGFQSPQEQTITIAPDGTSSVIYSYKRNVHTLTIYPNNGNAMTTKSFRYGQKLGDAIAAVSLDDCTFAGWYTDKGLTSAYSGSTIMADGALSLYAYFDGDTKPAELSYEENDSAISITGYNGSSDKIIIPNYINNKKVTSIDNLASSTIVSVKLPKTVTAISANAFENSTSLVSVNLTEVETIGAKAFSGCTEFIGSAFNCLQTIGEYAFNGCVSLENIVLPDTLTGDLNCCFYNCSNLENIIISCNITSICANSFYGCSSLKEMTLPFIGASLSMNISSSTSRLFGYIFGTTKYDGGVATNQVFKNGSFGESYTTYYIPVSLSKITINGGNIAYGAFSNCVGLSAIILSSDIQQIATKAFYNCSALTSILIPDSVTNMEDGAFSGCGALASMSLPSVGSVFARIFGEENYTGATKVSDDGSYYYVPTSLNIVRITKGSIPSFEGLSRLTNIYVPETANSIAAKTFYGCNNLIELKIPETVTSIGASAFGLCAKLNNIVLPSGITKIESNTFYGCSSLQSIVIPNGVSKIEWQAFYGCNGLVKIVFENNSKCEDIGDRAFYNCSNITSLELPDSLKSIGEDILNGCSNIETLVVPFIGESVATKVYSSIQYPIGYFFGDTGGGLKTSQFEYAGSTVISKSYYIPKSLKSVKVTIGDILHGAFSNCTTITDVIICNETAQIGDYAFYGCVGLTDFVLPSKTTSIGKNAFYGCSGLVNAVIPDSVSKLGESAFAECGGLEIVQIGDGITDMPDYVFRNCNALRRVLFGEKCKLSIIGARCFGDCSGLAEIVIPDTVTSIGQYAFNNCSSLMDIIIPGSVQTLDYAVLGGCSGLMSITVPFIGETASETTANYSTVLGYLFGGEYTGGIATQQYYKSDSSKTYYIPRTLASVTVTGGNIFYGAFSNCNNVSHIAIPDEIINIEERLFYGCTNLNSILIPNGVTSIGDSAFYGCRNITSIELPSGIDKIGQSTFYDCSSLTSIEIPNDVVSIGVSAFSGCNMLGNITFVGKDKLLSIGDNAFEDCSMLANIVIPDSVTSIGYAAFNGCSNLEEISVPFAGGEQVESTTDTQKHLFGYIFGDSFDGAYSIQQGYYSSATGVYGGMTYYIPQSLKTVEVKGGKILEHAFDDCYGIDNIIIGDKVSYIGKSAFSDCRGLTSINIPDSVTNIDNHAFYDCTKLVDINIGKGVKAIGSGAFHGCSSLTEIIIPEGVERLSDNVFALCTALTSVTIPSSVTSVGTYLFSKDCENLVIKYQGKSIPDTWDENWNAYGYTVQFVGND